MLDLSENNLKVLPPEILKLENLKILILSKCQLAKLQQFSGLINLNTIRLQFNDLDGSAIQQLPTSVQYLNLANNHINSIVPSFSCLSNLLTLDLSYNKIQSLDGIESLHFIVELILDYNDLVKLPEELCLLTKLKILSLKFNKLQKWIPSQCIQSIPASFLISTGIDKLELTGNLLTNKELLEFQGIDNYLERRKIIVNKQIYGGALINNSLFGLN